MSLQITFQVLWKQSTFLLCTVNNFGTRGTEKCTSFYCLQARKQVWHDRNKVDDDLLELLVLPGSMVCTHSYHILGGYEFQWWQNVWRVCIGIGDNASYLGSHRSCNTTHLRCYSWRKHVYNRSEIIILYVQKCMVEPILLLCWFVPRNRIVMIKSDQWLIVSKALELGI